MGIFGGELTFLAVLLVVAVLWYEGEHLLRFIHWTQDSIHRPRIVAERDVAVSEHIELDSVVLPPPPVIEDMPPGRGFLHNEVARRRYVEPQVAQQMVAMRSHQIAAIQASNTAASS